MGARIVGDARLRQRGGICPWPAARTDITNHLKEDQGCIATTMVDYYGMPQTGPGEWPGRARATGLRTVEEKAQCVQKAVRDNLVMTMGARFDAKRFVPFVVMHEFEGLLFSDCAAFSRGIHRPDLESNFRETANSLRRRKTSTIRRSALPQNASRLSCKVTRSLFLEYSPYWRLASPVFGQNAPTSTRG